MTTTPEQTGIPTAEEMNEQWEAALEKMEERRSLIGCCNRIYPNWKGEHVSEEWFMADTLQRGETLWMLEKFYNTNVGLIVLKVCCEDLYRSFGDVLVKMEQDKKLTSYMEMDLVGILTRLDVINARLSEKRVTNWCKDADYFAATWMLNAVQNDETGEHRKASPGVQFPYLWRLAENIEEAFYAKYKEFYEGLNEKESVTHEDMQTAVMFQSWCDFMTNIKVMLHGVLLNHEECLSPQG